MTSRHIFMFLLLLAAHAGIGQGVGIGTTDPDSSAILDLSATDKGLLIPRMSTSQRLNLTTPATGLLVYDSDTMSFWYFNGSDWADVRIDDDANPLNEIQTISKTGNTVTLSNGGGTFIDANTTYDASDFVPSNQVCPTGQALKGFDAIGMPICIPVDDADNNPTNELQTISKTGNTVTLSDGGGTFIDDVDDADHDPTNEIETWSTLGGIPSGFADDSDDVDDADANPLNELQTISRSGDTITLSNGGGSIMDVGIFEQYNGVVRSTASTDDDFVFGMDALPQNGTSYEESLLFFDESKSAFRAGALDNSFNWAPDSIGNYSFATGRNTKASGHHSVAHGWASFATGSYSVAHGLQSKASGSGAFSTGQGTLAAGSNTLATGFLTQANGQSSFAQGYWTKADAQYSSVFGTFNVGGGTPNAWIDSDPIFEIGIGSLITPANALTVLKDGTVSFREYAFPNTDGASGQVLATDGAGQLSWQEEVGVFESFSGVVYNTGPDNDDFVFGADQLPTGNVSDTLFFFDQTKGGAFRAGQPGGGDRWSPENIGSLSFAAGLATQASGQFSAAFGHSTDANGQSSFAAGELTNATGTGSTAFGGLGTASGDYAMVTGHLTDADGNYSFAAGQLTSASGDHSTATGLTTDADGNCAFATGIETDADAYASFSLGRYNIGGGNSTTWTATDPVFEIGIGSSNSNRANAVTVLKNGTVSFNEYTFPNTDGASGQVLATDGAGQLSWQEEVGVFESFSGVVRNTGPDHDDFVFGADQLPTGNVSDTLFFFDQSKGGAFRAGQPGGGDRWSPENIGSLSFAAGLATQASGQFSAAFGHSTDANGQSSFAAGELTNATGTGSTAFGGLGTASGDYAMVTGYLTDADGNYSFAAGQLTSASGDHSTATGLTTDADGNCAFATGIETDADAYASFSLGRYNIGGGNSTTWTANDPVFEIGIGSSSANRQNAITVLKNGTVSFNEYTFPNTDGASGQVLATDGSGALQWQNEYGVFENASGLVRNVGSSEDDFIFGSSQLPSGTVSDTLFFFDQSKGAFRTGVLGSDDAWSTENLGRGSFAAGYDTKASGWFSVSVGIDSDATGRSSFAAGDATDASGRSSTALGELTNATGDYSLATGWWTIASGDNSFTTGRLTSAPGLHAAAFGHSTSAEGAESVAMGYQTDATAYGSLALGRYNIGGGNDTAWIDSDPVFEIGNGTGTGVDASNALTVLKNGKTGIGTHTPDEALSVVGTLRGAYQESETDFIEIGHGGNNAFINADGTGNMDFRHHDANIMTLTQDQKVGIRTNNPDSDLHIKHINSGGSGGLKLENTVSEEWARFYISSSNGFLRIYMDSVGIIGTFDDVSGAYSALSDRRLKENFRDLHFDWESFAQLQPLTYSFKADNSGQQHVGLVAQDVAEIYPELVTYDRETDRYHMDYAGFGVIAIKAIQEQQKTIAHLKDALTEKDAEIHALTERMDRLEAALARLSGDE